MVGGVKIPVQSIDISSGNYDGHTTSYDVSIFIEMNMKTRKLLESLDIQFVPKEGTWLFRWLKEKFRAAFSH